MAWERIIEKEYKNQHIGDTEKYNSDKKMLGTNVTYGRGEVSTKTTGWQPRCKCDAGEPVPCVVWDLFGGSGTVAVVANRLNRNWVLTELSEKYIKLAEQRIGKQAGLGL